MMVAVVIAASEAVSQEADSGGTEDGGSWINDWSRIAVSVIGGGAAGTQDHGEAGEDETMKFLLHGTSSDEGPRGLFENPAKFVRRVFHAKEKPAVERVHCRFR